MSQSHVVTKTLLDKADELHAQIGSSLHDRVTTSTYAAASELAGRAVHVGPRHRFNWDLLLDRLVTSRWLGIPFMAGLLAFVFWLTIAGANVPSAFLAGILIDEGGLSSALHEYLGVQDVPTICSYSVWQLLHSGFAAVHAPAWLSGFLIDGVYLGMAWVVSVMLPPMAIFFPMFTLMEDLGLLPRVAFNMDRFFRTVGAHGKQALTMSMGFGCNAAGVVACRIIDSPRERLIAILTNNFVPCNGRWPTLIMVSSLFVAAAFPAWLATFISVGTVMAVTMLGIAVTLAVSFLLSHTMLKGVASSFTLEMPPYRRPQVGRVLYTSLIDRTVIVLWRAIVCSAPAGGLIWLLGAVQVGDASLFIHLRNLLDPVGHALGLDGVILIGFLFAIPANEIVIPTIVMGYMHTSRMTELADPSQLFIANGWTPITAICLLLFVLLHYPCTTTSYSILKETGSWKWVGVANIIPLAIALFACAAVAQSAHLLGF